MIGIYKITNPKGKVYIGQSVNIEKRFKVYKKIQCIDQPKIYNSLRKYGSENHIFEILEECLVEYLDEREIFYKQQIIEKLSKDKILFCHLIDGKGGYKSQETKDKISKANKGKKHSLEACLKKSNSLKNRKYTDDTIQKMIQNNKGKSRNKGIKKSKNHCFNISKNVRKPVLQYDLYGNFIKEWEGSIEVKNLLGLDINSCINGKAKTSGGFIWRKKSDPLPLNFDSKIFLIKKDKGIKKPMSDQHKKNISKALKGRKCTWNTKPKKSI